MSIPVRLVISRTGVAHEQKRKRVVTLERIFFATGLALLAVWAGAMFHRFVFSRVALAAFNKNEATGSSSALSKPDTTTNVDFASWSTQRIQAYEDSLLQKADAPLAVLRIPKIHLEVPVFNGTDDVTLNRGVGRIVGTSQLGVGGNLGIAGHRDGFFRGLKDIEKGDVIELERPGQTDFYKVDWIRIVGPADISVLDSTPDSSLTLVTCFPFYFVGSAPQRYIVRAFRTSSSQSGESASKDPISMGSTNQTKGE